jgi:hypothetical protein
MPWKVTAKLRKATYRSIQVEILVEYDSGNEKFAAIRAIDGKPFHRKDEWSSITEYATVSYSDLTDVQYESENEPEQSTILDMALAYSHKKQWSSGESIWLWRNAYKGVYLKEQDGFVALNITEYREYLIVYWLDPKTWTWKISRNLGVNYYQWIERYKESTR